RTTSRDVLSPAAAAVASRTGVPAPGAGVIRLSADALPGVPHGWDGRCRGRLVRHGGPGRVDRGPVRDERLRGWSRHVRLPVRGAHRRSGRHAPDDLGGPARREGAGGARTDAGPRGTGG